MLVYNEEATPTTTLSGTVYVWSANTREFLSGVMLFNVFVKAATATTTFDFSLTDDGSRMVKEWTGSYGELNQDLRLPLKGMYTMAIANASVGEAFEVKLTILERGNV